MFKIKNYLAFLLYILLNPSLLKLLLLEIYIPAYIQYAWLKKYRINTVIDVGALRGTESKALKYMFPKSDVYAFEPMNNKSLSKVGKEINVINMPLSDKKRKVFFYRYKKVEFSSLLRFSSKYVDRFSSDKYLEKIGMVTTTLDSYFKKKELKGLVFLKIDTQGTEDLVLKGGKRILETVSIIHVETSFDKIYDGQALFEDIYKYLVGYGFLYMGNIPDAYFYQTFSPQVQQNSVFIKKDLVKF